ncbi:MAG TPA: xanthine dehydrogenase family protein subunit M [Gemmatimonadales bacterium]|nr:xanthine dehydrogenase family protein subunit M [Gemmatimonadales bacterium]
MKPASFAYHRAESAQAAMALLDQFGGEAKVLAGGQSLIPAMNFRLARPARLIDINPATDLAYVRGTGTEGLHIGAMARQRDVERSSLVQSLAPLLHEAMPFVAHPQIRNRGTIGGSLAHADPAAELPAVMVAIGARFQVGSREGTRWIGASDFFTGLFATALKPTELLLAVHVPAPQPRSGHAFIEFSRRHGDYALVGVAATVWLDGRDACAGARIALLSVGDAPVPAHRAVQALEGQVPSSDVIQAAAHAASRHDVDPPGDIHASSDYRRHLVGVLVRRALTRAFERARRA